MKTPFTIQIRKLRLGEVRGFVPNSYNKSKMHRMNIHGLPWLFRMANKG